MSEHPPTLVWFRNDLRVADHPALAGAATDGGPVVPVFIHDETRPIGGAAQWWLHHSLEALGASLDKLGSPLVLRAGDPEQILPALAKETCAGCVRWNRRYEPGDAERDERLRRRLEKTDCRIEFGHSGLLQEPGAVLTKAGAPYHVFTPFARVVRAADADQPQAAPRALQPPKHRINSERLADWKLLPTKPDWSTGFGSAWRPGEAAARKRLVDFLDDRVDHYSTERDRPDHDGTSRLSPHLHWGEISVREAWAAALHHQAASRHRQGAETFLNELIWREFAGHLLFHHPELPNQPMRKEFAKFPWIHSAARLHAWQQGRTGYPIVDAGMRQLWTTGWMHNRVRMIVASFLTKHLLLPWQDGAAWFMDTLVDGDLAANSTNWQWVAGCGADAAPYFRIFNPILQGKKFDPDGDYVREWVPELEKRGVDAIHVPLEADEACGGYPQPIVRHGAAREAALEAFRGIRRS